MSEKEQRQIIQYKDYSCFPDHLSLSVLETVKTMLADCGIHMQTTPS